MNTSFSRRRSRLGRLFPLARKEYHGLIRSKGTWLFVFLLIPWAYRPDYPTWDALGSNITLAYVQGATRIVLPLGILLLSYRSIVNERTSKSITFTLGLPLTRTEILLGKIVGTTAGIGGPLVVSLVLLSGIGLLNHGPFDPTLFIAHMAVTLLYVSVLVTIAIAISAVAKGSLSAGVAAFGGVFLVLELGWNTITFMVYSIFVDGSVDPYAPPESGILFLLNRLSPGGAYRTVSNWILGTGNSAAGYDVVVRELMPNTTTDALVVETGLSADSPWYLYEGFGLVLLIGWIVSAFALARWQFCRGDLV